MVGTEPAALLADRGGMTSHDCFLAAFVVKRHETLAGIAGLAFHAMPASETTKTAIYVCRDYDFNANVFMIDELRGDDATYIFGLSADDTADVRSDRAAMAAAYRAGTTLDMRKIRGHLAAIGLRP